MLKQKKTDGLKLIKLAKVLGFEVKIGQDFGGSNREITIDVPAKTLAIKPDEAIYWFYKDLAHELGHVILAPKGRRFRKDYGIKNGIRRSYRSKLKWDFDEAKATLIEHHLLNFVGLKYLKEPLGKLLGQKAKVNKWWKIDGEQMVDILLSLI